MRFQLPRTRLVTSLALATILMALGVNDAFAQRTRTGTTRGSTKVERSSGAKKATPKRTPSRATPTRSTPSRATPSRSTGSRAAPSRGTPSRATPSRSTPSRATPSRSTPSRRSQAAPSRQSASSRGSRTSTASKSTRSSGVVQDRDSRSSGTVRGSGTRTNGSGAVRGSGTRTNGSGAVRGSGTRGNGSGAVRGSGTRTNGSGTVRGSGTRTNGSGAVRGNGSGTRGNGTNGTVRNGSSRGTGQGGTIVGDRRPRNGPATRNGRTVRGSRSLLRDTRRDGRRVHIPSRRWNYRRPAYVVPRYTRTQLRRYRPRIHVDIYWPWVVRYERRWRPTYRYHQVVHVNTVVYGRPSRAQIEVETVYSHEVVHANDEFAELDVRIERLELFENGRLLGYIDQIPSSLSQMTATVYRDGEVYFDREIFLIGDRYAGFEVISTRAYDGYVLDAYHHSDGYRAGSVDLRRHRVRSKKSSRLFRPNRADSHVPISLLPSDEGWLWDYGIDAISATVDDYGWYYGDQGRTRRAQPAGEGWSQQDAWDYKSEAGADIRFERQSKIQRVQ